MKATTPAGAIFLRKVIGLSFPIVAIRRLSTPKSCIAASMYATTSTERSGKRSSSLLLPTALAISAVTAYGVKDTMKLTALPSTVFAASTNALKGFTDSSFFTTLL